MFSRNTLAGSLGSSRSSCFSLFFKRTYLSPNPGMSSSDVSLERRPKRKIKIGKARPANYFKFDTRIQLTDGSVIIRRSQFPRIETKNINDQRNHPLWNPSRNDLTQVNEQAADRLNKFKQKYSMYQSVQIETPVDQKSDEPVKTETEKSAKPVPAEEDDDAFGLSDYLDIMGENVQEVQKGGKLLVKTKTKKKGKK